MVFYSPDTRAQTLDSGGGGDAKTFSLASSFRFFPPPDLNFPPLSNVVIHTVDGLYEGCRVMRVRRRTGRGPFLTRRPPLPPRPPPRRPRLLQLEPGDQGGANGTNSVSKLFKKLYRVTSVL